MRKILIVIDMQKDFIDGSLGTPEAQAIVPRVAELMKQYDPADIFATRDTHTEKYMETREGKYLPVEHCIRGTDGWKLHRDIKKQIFRKQLFDKPTFGSELLVHAMRKAAAAGEISITMAGLCTDICVISNALMLHAALPEVEIAVVADCCAGVTPAKHEAALEVMRSCQIQVK